MKKTKNSWLSIRKVKAKYVFFASFIFSLFLFSCVKEGDFEFDKLASNQYDPTIAAPFISSRLTLKDILNDTSGIIQVNTSDNSLKLVYVTDKLVSVMARDLFKIPNQHLLSDTSNMPLPPIPVGNTFYYAMTKPFPFVMPRPDLGQRMDSIFIKTALLNLDITTNINHAGKIVLSSPNIIRANGQLFNEEILLDYPRDTTQIVPKNIDISGCKIIFDNSFGHSNELLFKFEHSIYGDANINMPLYHTELNCNISNILYQKLFGYIGQYPFPLLDTLDISINNNQLQGQFEFNSVTAGITTLNSYGLPIEIKVDKFQAQNGSTILNVNDFPAQNPFNINYPVIVGATAVTSIQSTASSDLAQAINISPKKIIYNLTGKANPANNPNIPNFVLDTSNFSVNMQIEIPLEGKVGGFVLQDTIDFNLNDINSLNEATFRINTWNAFPLSANIQVYFADISFNILDSLVTNGQDLVSSGSINPVTHMVSAPTYRLNEYVMSKSHLIKIENAKKMLIRGKLTTPNYPNQIIKISNNDYLDVKLSMKVKINTNNK